MKEICALYYHLQSLGTYKENWAEKIEKILGRKIPLLYHIRYDKANLQHALDEKNPRICMCVLVSMKGSKLELCFIVFRKWQCWAYALKRIKINTIFLNDNSKIS